MKLRVSVKGDHVTDTRKQRIQLFLILHLQDMPPASAKPPLLVHSSERFKEYRKF